MKINSHRISFLEERRKLYEQGHKNELLYCVIWCMQYGVPIPPWLHYEFMQAYFAVIALEKSWNDVFGDPLPMSKRAKRMHSRQEYVATEKLLMRFVRASKNSTM